VLRLPGAHGGMGSRWFNGQFSSARRLRPDLFVGEFG
jgi:hypothetical protein